MRISILVQGSPTTTRACESAYKFATTVADSDHELFRVFFYQDAVEIGHRHADSPPDEINLQQHWRDLGRKNNIELMLCVSAAQRRGIAESKDYSTVAEGYSIAGLGQLVEAMLESDRVVSFTA